MYVQVNDRYSEVHIAPLMQSPMGGDGASRLQEVPQPSESQCDCPRHSGETSFREQVIQSQIILHVVECSSYSTKGQETNLDFSYIQ